MRNILYILTSVFLLNACGPDQWVEDIIGPGGSVENNQGGSNNNQGDSDKDKDKDNPKPGTTYTEAEIRAKLKGGWSVTHKDTKYQFQFLQSNKVYRTKESQGSDGSKSYYWCDGEFNLNSTYIDNKTGDQIAYFIYQNSMSQYHYNGQGGYWISDNRRQVTTFYIVVPELMERGRLRFKEVDYYYDYYYIRDNSVNITEDPFSHLVND